MLELLLWRAAWNTLLSTAAGLHILCHVSAARRCQQSRRQCGNGVHRCHLCLSLADVVRGVSCVDVDAVLLLACWQAIPGGYEIGNVVYSLISHSDEDGSFSPGCKGRIKGVASNGHPDTMVLCRFDGYNNNINCLLTQVSRDHPNDVSGPAEATARI